MLVDARIGEGRKLLELLNRIGFDVAVAAWVKTGDEGPWYLYVATDSVDRLGLGGAYAELYRVHPSVPDAWALLSDVKLVGPDSPVARDLFAIQGLIPTRSGSRSLRSRLGNLSVDEVYVYPPLESAEGGFRRAFTARYERQDGTNRWQATAEPGKRVRGVGASGAVAYSTARRAVDDEGDEPFALVAVLLDVDSQLDPGDAYLHPDVRATLTELALRSADAMFLSRHPGAVIEHAGR